MFYSKCIEFINLSTGLLIKGGIVKLFLRKLHTNAWFKKEDLCLGHLMHHLPVGLYPIVDVSADVISDALLLLLSFITNILCVKNKQKITTFYIFIF